MRFSRMITVVGAHAAGELNEVITGGVLDVPGKTMFEKMQYVQTHRDELRKFLLNEPRGRVSQCVNLVLPPTTPEADAGFVIIEVPHLDAALKIARANPATQQDGGVEVRPVEGGFIVDRPVTA